MKMVDLKMEEPRESTALAMPMEPSYPYGCALCLSEEELEALGFDELPPAGTTMEIQAIGVVVSSGTEDPDADGDVDHAHVRIQLTHLGIEEDSDKNRTAKAKGKAAKLYGGDTDKDAA